MGSKYVDTAAIIQVIGCVYNNVQILDFADKYMITENDFADQFHKIIFGSIFKLHELGANTITVNSIVDFLSSRPKFEEIFKREHGEEWLLKASECATPTAFDYYYNRLKKMSLLRAYDSHGVDVSDIYDPDILFDPKKKQLQEELLDNSSLEDIANKVDLMIDSIRSEYLGNQFGQSYQAGDGVFSLIEKLKESPEIGTPLFGPVVNTVTRGARLKKFYLRSAPSGVGKSRAMIADACYIGCNQIYYDDFGWVANGYAEPTLYISTELTIDEVQTMMLAFLSNVNEEHILNGSYVGDEEKRVMEAAKILSESPLYIEELPDFSLSDIENVIKKNIREHDVAYVFHDYIHTSLKILEEISKKSGGMKLREDNILFMLSIKLKDLCNQYGIFLLSSTQLNADYQHSETPDQNLLRGAKSIADKIDVGMIMLGATETDLEALNSILSSNIFDKPNLKISVYKNRRGRYKGVYLWCKADLGTCRITPMFCTTWSYENVPIEDFKINVTLSAF